MLAHTTELLELSVIVPVKDEAENLKPLINELTSVLDKSGTNYEILYVDDGSVDRTPERLKKLEAQVPRLCFLRHPQCFGQSAAIFTGVKAAKGVAIATLDGDGQNDPADIPILFERYRQEKTLLGSEFVMIAGYRARRKDTLLKQMSSRIANAVRRVLLKDDTLDTGCGLKVFARAAFMALPHFNHMHRFLPALIIRAGGRVLSVPVNHRPRAHGVSKYGVWNRLWVGITDLLGVMWLTRRSIKAAAENQDRL